MAENTTLNQTVESWADIVIKEWLKKVDSLGIGKSEGSTGALVQSFHQHVLTNAEGDPSRVLFAFEYYGLMVDYGVGRGVNLHDRDSMIAAGLTTRRPKTFHTDVFYKQLEVLRHLLEEKHAINIENLMVSTLSEK